MTNPLDIKCGVVELLAVSAAEVNGEACLILTVRHDLPNLGCINLAFKKGQTLRLANDVTEVLCTSELLGPTEDKGQPE